MYVQLLRTEPGRTKCPRDAWGCRRLLRTELARTKCSRDAWRYHWLGMHGRNHKMLMRVDIAVCVCVGKIINAPLYDLGPTN